MASAAPTAVSVAPTIQKPPEKTLFEMAKEFFLLPFDKMILSTVPEIGHLAPVILTLGTAFLGIITLNWPLSVFSASSFEALMFYNILKVLSDYSITPILGMDSTPLKGVCQSYFQTMTPSRFSWFLQEGVKKSFPNKSLYFISFAASYCIQSLLTFSKEASELGPKVSNRPYLAIAGAAMFIGLYALYLSSYGCETFFSIIGSITFGVLIGMLICYQNYLLFDKSSVNLMFIPPLVRRSGMDYLCVSSK